MSKTKMIWIACLAFLILALAIFLPQALKVMTGYTAKYVCSSVFIADATDHRLEKDLDFFPINTVKYTIDRSDRSVRATAWGMSALTAYFYEEGPSCGCSFTPKEKNSLQPKTPSEPSQLSDTLSWPHGSGPIEKTIETVDYEKLEQHLRTTLDSNASTLALCVAYKGELIAEDYNDGLDRHSPLLGWSMTKTIGNALIGILVQEGRIDIEDDHLIPLWSEDERASIAWTHLLKMESGLKFNENYFMLSHVTRMLYLKEDKYKYACQSKLAHEPGKVWNYSSGTSNILSGLLRDLHESDTAYWNFPRKKLFDPLGMQSALIEMDGAGNYVLSSYGWATARDWTRFGQLYLNDGMWNGKRLLPEGWVKYSTTPARASDGLYGAQIWLNTDRKAISSVPADAYFENGFGGQRVLVIPSKDLVITVLSGFNPTFDFDALYKGIFDCIQED